MLELQSSTYNKDTMPCTHLCHPGVTTLLTHVCNIWASCYNSDSSEPHSDANFENSGVKKCMMSSTLGRLKSLKGFGQGNARVPEIGDQDYYYNIKTLVKQSIYNLFDTVKHTHIYIYIQIMILHIHVSYGM